MLRLMNTMVLYLCLAHLLHEFMLYKGVLGVVHEGMHMTVCCAAGCCCFRTICVRRLIGSLACVDRILSIDWLFYHCRAYGLEEIRDCHSRWRDSKAVWSWWSRRRSDDDTMNPVQHTASCKGRSGALLWLCNMRQRLVTRPSASKQQDAMGPVNHLSGSTPGESPYEVPSWLLSGNIPEQGLLEQQAWNRRASVWLWQQQQAALANDCGVLGL
eukprot:jgi/Chrzof1/5981/UNPLg00826.t1